MLSLRQACCLAAAPFLARRSAVRRLLLFFVALLPLLTAASAGASPQNKKQQRCINKAAKTLRNTIRFEQRSTLLCINGWQANAVPSADLCIAMEPTQVTTLKNKLGLFWSKKCSGSSTPGFGASALSVGSAISTFEQDPVANAIVGWPKNDYLLKLTTGTANDNNCQRTAIDQVDRLQSVMARQLARCLKLALKGKSPFSSPAASSLDLQPCMTDLNNRESVPANHRVIAAISRLRQFFTVGERRFVCSGGLPLITGKCGGLSGSVLADCLVARAKCNFCFKVAQGMGAYPTAISCEQWSGVFSTPTATLPSCVNWP